MLRHFKRPDLLQILLATLLAAIFALATSNGLLVCAHLAWHVFWLQSLQTGRVGEFMHKSCGRVRQSRATHPSSFGSSCLVPLQRLVCPARQSQRPPRTRHRSRHPAPQAPTPLPRPRCRYRQTLFVGGSAAEMVKHTEAMAGYVADRQPSSSCTSLPPRIDMQLQGGAEPGTFAGRYLPR